MNGTAADCSGGSAQVLLSAKGGRAAATRSGNSGVYAYESRLRRELRCESNQQRNVKRMTKGRGGGLSERGAERAGSVGGRCRIDAQLRMAGRCEMTQLVIDRTLLRR